MKYYINNIISVILTSVIYLLGGVDIALTSLLIVIIIDYITGLLTAIYNKNLNSKVGLKGIIKKFCYLLIVCLSVIIDNITNMGGAIRTLVIYFFVANESLSIIENMGKIGVPIPEKLKNIIEQLNEKEGD